MATAKTFRGCQWSWDETANKLFCTRKEKDLKEGRLSLSMSKRASGSPTFGFADAVLEFMDTINSLQMANFRRLYQRRVKPTEPEVITIQDIKDVALYTANRLALTVDFINYFHMPSVDKFLRAFIIYFTYYLQVWDNLMARRVEERLKLRQPIVYKLEDNVRDNLADLRAMVAREYARVIMGLGDAWSFYHFRNGTQSLSDKDRRLFELLVVLSVRVIWIAMQRKSLNLIDKEVNRLLRTDNFNMFDHRIPTTKTFDISAAESRVLLGRAFTVERKLKHRSPCVQELIFDNHDHRMLALGILEIQPCNERIKYLEACYAAPEEMLLDLGVGIGLLGVPRDDLDAMMKPKQRTKSRKDTKEPRKIPEFKLPPHVEHSKTIIVTEVLPDKPCQFTETQQTIIARKRQCIKWRLDVKENIKKAFAAVSKSK